MDAAVPLTETPGSNFHPPDLEQHESWLVIWFFNSIFSFFASYGWLLVMLVAIYFFFRDKISSKLNAWKQQREDAEYHKNPDKFLEREMAVQEARLKLQNHYAELALEHEQKAKEKEEKKRQQNLERLEKLQRGESVKYNVAESDSVQPTINKKPKATLRPSFNPMMGGTPGASGWRPSRRGGAGGG